MGSAGDEDNRLPNGLVSGMCPFDQSSWTGRGLGSARLHPVTFAGGFAWRSDGIRHRQGIDPWRRAVPRSARCRSDAGDVCMRLRINDACVN